MIQGLRNGKLLRETCYINGQWVPADLGKTMVVKNPATGAELGNVPECTQTETRRAIEAANQAWKSWRALSAKERASMLLSWAHLIDQNMDDLAYIITMEQGKPLSEARGEVEYANNFIKWFAEEGRRAYGEVIPANERDRRIVVLKQPVGVVGAITPWNFPAAMITRKIAPALTVGCTVVIKPDEATPYSALALAVLAEQAGLPAGVLNVITGQPEVIGGELTANSLVRKISFTGSTAVGRLLMQQSAATIKKLSLELGGNAPFIVFEDADLDAAITGAMASKFRNSGQTCVSANRFIVHDSIYLEFAKRLTHKVRELRVGNGFDQNVQQGPLINEAAVAKVKEHIADAVAKGAQVICGGKSHALGGLFFEPTILTEVNSSMRLVKEETFGPVAALMRFHTEEQAIQLANDTEFGLAAYFYSNNYQRVWRLAEALESGIVGINAGIISTEVAPFGGVKQSGIGREGSKYGLNDYLEIKYLCMG